MNDVQLYIHTLIYLLKMLIFCFDNNYLTAYNNWIIGICLENLMYVNINKSEL